MVYFIIIKLIFDKVNEKIVINSVFIGINIIVIVNIVDIICFIYVLLILICIWLKKWILNIVRRLLKRKLLL